MDIEFTSGPSPFTECLELRHVDELCCEASPWISDETGCCMYLLHSMYSILYRSNEPALSDDNKTMSLYAGYIQSCCSSAELRATRCISSDQRINSLRPNRFLGVNTSPVSLPPCNFAPALTHLTDAGPNQRVAVHRRAKCMLSANHPPPSGE